MENAVKALIIAGTILIIILLISAGIFILNSSRNSQEQAKQMMDTMEVQTFNEQFLAYEGSIVNASQVKSLLLLVQANNSYYQFNAETPVGTDKFIKVEGIISTGLLYVNQTYHVQITNYTTNGYISVITITQN